MTTNQVFDIIKSLDLINWKVMLVGWRRSWIAKEEVARYACELLGGHINDHDLVLVAALASAEHMKDDIVEDLLNKLAKAEEDDANLTMDKWRLGKLIALQMADQSWEVKTTRLEEIQAEFGFPDDMVNCTRYGPSKEAVASGFSTDINIDPLDAMNVVIADLKSRFVVDKTKGM